MATVARIALVAALVVASSGAFAQRSGSSDRSFWLFGQTGSSSNSQNLDYAKSPSNVVQMPGRTTATPDGGSGVRLDRPSQIRNGAGNVVNINSSGRLTNAGIARAVGKVLARNVIPIAGTAATIYGLYELLQELSITPEVVNGAVTLTKPGELACTEASFQAGTCWFGNNFSGVPGLKGRTRTEFCTAWAPARYGSQYKGVLRFQTQSNSWFCDATHVTNGSVINNIAVDPLGSAAPVAGKQPVSIAQVEADIAAKAGWPSSSFVALAAVNAGEWLVNNPTDPKDAPYPSAEDWPYGDPDLNVVQKVTTGPATSPGESTVQTSTNPDGSTRTQERTCVFAHTYTGTAVLVREDCYTTVTNDGESGKTSTSQETKNAPNTSEPQKTADGKEIVRIDETGTPAPESLDGNKSATDAMQPMRDFVTNPLSKIPAFPTLNWAFTLPSGCVPLAIPAFAPFLQAIDVCQFLPIFHDIMGFVWVLGGLFGAISLFWRSTFSAN